jgi:hypothetical protein
MPLMSCTTLTLVQLSKVVNWDAFIGLDFGYPKILVDVLVHCKVSALRDCEDRWRNVLRFSPLEPSRMSKASIRVSIGDGSGGIETIHKGDHHQSIRNVLVTVRFTLFHAL